MAALIEVVVFCPNSIKNRNLGRLKSVLQVIWEWIKQLLQEQFQLENQSVLFQEENVVIRFHTLRNEELQQFKKFSDDKKPHVDEFNEYYFRQNSGQRYQTESKNS